MSDQTTDRIPLAEPLREICVRLDVPYDYVKEILFTPGETTVVLYEGRNGTGKGGKFIGDDNHPATETLTFRTLS